MTSNPSPPHNSSSPTSTSTTHIPQPAHSHSQTRKSNDSNLQSIFNPHSIDSLSNPINEKNLENELIQFCDLPQDDLSHAIRHIVQQTQDSHSNIFINNTLQYDMERSINRLVHSNQPPIFQNNDTVQALERILNSHLFDSGPQDSSNHENDVSLTQNITSSSVNATLHRASKPRPDQEPSTLDNDQLFKAAAACLTHANRSNQDTHEYDQIDNDFALGFASEVSGDSSHLSPSPTDQTLVTESRKTLSAEQVEMSIDPRLQGEYSMADEFLHEDDSFEVTSSFLQDPSRPSHLLDLSMSNKNEDVLMRDGCLGNAIDIPTGFSGAQLATTCRSTNSPDPTKGIHSVISPRRLRARTAATKPQNTARAAKRRPGSSISAMLISGDPGARVTIPLKPGTSPDPSCSLATHDPNVDPFLQALEDLESTADKNAGSCYSRKRSRSSSDHISSNLRRHSTSQSVPRGIRPSSTLSSFMLSGVDVHGAGAGGGAAAVLAAAAAAEATGQTSRSITDLLTTYLRTTTLNPMPTDPALEDLSMLAPEPAEQPPESYNPDQFRSFNRIHWTKEEEELLLAEVEMNWQRYDCMAQIMKRHGPTGTVSQTFADRTGVSLKDKAVNISSRWYRDGTELSDLRRRAFARFRPKQLRGRPRSELAGLMGLMTSDDNTNEELDPSQDPIEEWAQDEERVEAALGT